MIPLAYFIFILLLSLFLFKRPLYFIPIFIRTTALLLLSDKDDRKTARVHLITKESCFLVFERDVVFEIVVVSFERFRVRENIETKATLLYP